VLLSLKRMQGDILMVRWLVIVPLLLLAAGCTDTGDLESRLDALRNARDVFDRLDAT
jgi:hypothetical protein